MEAGFLSPDSVAMLACVSLVKNSMTGDLLRIAGALREEFAACETLI